VRPAHEGAVATCGACGVTFVTPPVDESGRTADHGEGVVIDETGRGATFRQVESLMRERLGGPGRVLDIGCGGGQFMLALEELGWSVSGVDINPRAVALARERGLDVRLGTIADAVRPRDGFDAVVALHALEYFARPLAALDAAAASVRPGGVLALETPNVLWHRRQAAIGRLLRVDPARLMIVSPAPDRRLIAFSPKALTIALGNAGLVDVALLPAAPRASGGAAERVVRRAILATAALVAGVSRERILAAPSLVAVASRP